MFNILVFILQTAMLITVYVSLPLLFLFRLFYVIKERLALKNAIIVLLTPFSLSFYQNNNDKKFLKIYNIIVITLTIIAVLGILFTLYQKNL